MAAVLLQAHEPIIYQTVRRYFGKGLDLEDVLQAAREGFLHGISKFDASKGFRLTTYATWWVRSYAQKALAEEGTTIVVGRSVDKQISSLKKSGQEIPARLLAARGLRSISHLDAPIGDESDGATLGDMTAGPDVGPEATAADEDAQARRRELIGRAMTWLTPQEQEVVRRRILTEEPETLEELGASFERTRERIRQIEAKALAKLECALRKLMADDDAVLWGAEPPDKPARRRLPPLAPLAPASTVLVPAAIEPAPAPRVSTAEPPRAKQVAPPPAAPRLTPSHTAGVLPLRPPMRKPDGDDAWPLWERA
ncbi:sigma-70 family RNA polymerase sigma factor [Sorangium sp. So ce388]|uniref:sigma-70 family RNA polymerase sigma factor n=1 Tax=Sorangium sp. So ce388 TaxID=3133309 RepID=UPI003F5BF0C6